MPLNCDGCGAKNANRLSYQGTKNGLLKTCDRCDSVSTPWIPDVFFDRPYRDENIVFENQPDTWFDGARVESRQHKAILLKQLGVHESGDRVHGARILEKRRTYFL